VTVDGGDSGNGSPGRPALYASLRSGVTLLVHGVKPPLDAPVAALCEALAHADLFLYAVVRTH
jgi:hypothetical protein